MDALATTDAATMLAGQGEWMDDELLSALSAYPLDAIDTEYPHHARTLRGPDDEIRPREEHPIFYGCFDWHSAVHNHWCLIRQLRLFDDHPAEADIRSALADRITAEKVEQEADYFADHESFERPYGWAWFLQLVAELARWDADRATAWREAFAPLERRIVDLVERKFLTQQRPFRVGTHNNSAFALQFVLDYAQVVGNESLAAAVEQTARDFYQTDRAYPAAYEPLGWDFLSPALTEADLMRRVLEPDAFQQWFDAFLPNVTDEPSDGILEPVAVDGDGGLALHFVGLNLARAWAMADVASALEEGPEATALADSARRHVDHSLEHAFIDDYAGAHWLSSFVLYLLTRHQGGAGPEP